MDAQTFDYLIVGGGSAGCVLAARLSADPQAGVCLLEAGGRGDGWVVHTPAAAVAMLPTRLNNYAFDTVPQAGLNGRTGYQPRGRMLGGSSGMNAMVYIRGHRRDYDEWAAMGNRGWSYDELLPYFRRSECNERLDDRWHGVNGPLPVSDSRSGNPWSQRFLQAAQQAGHLLNDDFNGERQDGFGLFQLTQRDGERWSAARAFLAPHIGKRRNLDVRTGVQVTRLLLEGRRVVGVECMQNGQAVRLHARREVVLAAGALLTPQLMLLSGIGPGDRLQRLGIPVAHHLEGVGENLQDHPDFIFSWRALDAARTELVGFSPRGLWRLAREIGRYRRTRTGAITSNYAEAGGFIRSDPSLAAPDFQLHFVVSIADDHARKLHAAHGYSCHFCLLRPRSRGRVSLRTPHAFDAPDIDPAFFADGRDLDDMVTGFKLTRRVMDAPAFAGLPRQDLFTEGVHTDEQIHAVLRARADSVYHPVGSCRMGLDPRAGAVVDAQLRVHGIAGLRIVDASVMPSIVGGNTNAAVMAIAEKAADMMRGVMPAARTAGEPQVAAAAG